MTNLHNDRQNNLVSFLRHNRPIPAAPPSNLEQQLMDSLEPHAKQRRLSFRVTWTIPGAIATGFLFTSVSFGLRTPQTALEPKDLENFLVKNWYDTLDSGSYTTGEKAEAYRLLPTVSESQPALSVSAQ